MARTTSTLVQGVLGTAYDGETDLSPYISSANVIITRVETCAADRGYTLSDDELELMERWLAAYFYTMMDPLYKRKRTERAEGEFFDHNFLDPAKMLDPSGCLTALLEQKRARMYWGGKPKSEQIDYEDRD